MTFPLRILHVSSEMAPFAHPGGLGDVIAAFPNALASQGHDGRVVIPRYQEVHKHAQALTRLTPELPLSTPMGPHHAAVWQADLPAQKRQQRVQVYCLANAHYFDRPGLYGSGSESML